MAVLTSPFNFVEISKEIYTPDWADQVSMDIPFEDGEDGIITVKIKNVTPLFVRNGHAQNGEDPDKDFSMHIVNPETGQREYFIPGSTLKGCFRNVLEILSSGKLDRFDDDTFGYRSFNKNEKGYSAYMAAMPPQVAGWLTKDANEIYYFEECDGEYEEIPHDRIKDYFPGFYKGGDHETAEKKQESVKQGDECYPLIDIPARDAIPAGAYRLVCTGYIAKKNHEFLFPVNLLKPVEIDPKVAKAFLSVHKNTEYFAGKPGKNDGFLIKRLDEGKRIPVFVHKKDGKVSSMGIAKMYRFPFETSVAAAVRNSQNATDKMDLAETIFGTINQEESLAGRVHVGHAFTKSVIPDDACILIKGVLAEPRPSYYPLYLKQVIGQGMRTYADEKAEIAGRKRYRIRRNIVELGKGNGNESIMTQFRPIPASQEFTCQIAVHNLRKIEIGALLSAITFNGTQGVYHNIGMAKAFGYGKITCEVELSRFAHSVEDYISAFEKKMSEFLFEKYHVLFPGFSSVNQLLAIASEHEDTGLEQMNFDQCADGKKGTPYLVEDPKVAVHTNYDHSKVPLEAKIKHYAGDIQKLETLIDEGNILDALGKLRFLEDKFKNEGIPEEVLEEYGQKISVILNTPTQATPPVVVVEGTFEQFLNSDPKYTKYCNNVVNAFKKWAKTENNVVTAAELDVFVYAILKIREEHPKDDVKFKDLKFLEESQVEYLKGKLK